MKNLKAKIANIRKNNSLNVDCAFWGGVTSDNHDELLSLVEFGVCGFKAFLNPQDSYPDFSHLNRNDLKKAIEILEETNCVFAVSKNIFSGFTFQIVNLLSI